MSCVTDLILIGTGIELSCDGKPTDLMQRINNYLTEHGDGPMVQVSQLAGGYKGMQAHVFLGAYNHFNTERFVEFLESLDDTRHTGLQLLAQEEGECKFTFIWESTAGRADNHLRTCHTVEYPGCDPRCRRGADR